MLSEVELRKIIKMLNGSQREMEEVLEKLWLEPTGDTRVLPHLEAHLDDRRPYIQGVDSREIWYSELRWLVALAVSAERRKAGIDELVILLGVTYPLTSKKIYELALEAGLDPEANTSLVTLAKLIEMGKMPLIDKGF